MSGKTAIITGASSGIGLAVACLLASSGVRIIGVGRDAARCESAKQAILKCAPGASIDFLLCDLSSQKEILALCRRIREQTPVIDILLNAAGLMAADYTETEDGIELQFAVNHMAPFLLSHYLIDSLKASGDARIITISSMAHRLTPPNFSDIGMRRHYSSFVQYGRTKLYNVLFAAEFNRRYKDTNIRAFAADPGLVKTNFGASGTRGLIKYILRSSLKRGAEASIPAKNISFLALSPQPLKSGSVYWKDSRPHSHSRLAGSEDAAKKLWEISQKYCRFGLTL